MDAQTFDAFLDDTLAKIRTVLASKGSEYVPEDQTSRFHNFDISAGLNGSSPEQALWGFVTKHIVSLSDMVKVDSTEHALASWNEKIGDVINYMILLKGMVHHHSYIAGQRSDISESPVVSLVIGTDDPDLPKLMSDPSQSKTYVAETVVINKVDVGDIDFARSAGMVQPPPTIRPTR